MSELIFLPLTKREHEILILLACGHRRAQIGQLCKIAQQTVKTHINNIFDKLSAANASHAVAVALVHGLILVEDINPVSGHKLIVPPARSARSAARPQSQP